MFELQLNFAEKHNIPVILHIREAMFDAMRILRQHIGLKLLFHCYSGGLEYLEQVLELGGMCAFGGALTWNNSVSEELRKVLEIIPLENILLETDSPYMSPIPFRGKINEPAYVKYVYEVAARNLGMTVNSLAEQIESNAKNFFGWE